MWASTHHSWGTVPDCYRAVFALWLATLEGMRAECIAVQLAAQAIDVRVGGASLGARELERFAAAAAAATAGKH